MIPLIGLTGGIGAGKSTVAADLAKALGYEPASFSTYLKRACDLVFAPLGVPPSAWYGTQEEKGAPQAALAGRSGRDVMERVGTEGFRAVVPDVWVRLALLPHDREGRRLVFDDVRFDNEAEHVRRRGGLILHLVVEGEERSRRPHASDAGVAFVEGDLALRARRGEVDELLRLARRAALEGAGGA